MECAACHRKYASSNNLRRHQRLDCGNPAKRVKLNTSYCAACDSSMPSSGFVGHQRSRQHMERTNGVPLDDGVRKIQSAFKSRIASYRVTPTDHFIDTVAFMSDLKDKICGLVRDQCRHNQTVKLNCELYGLFYLETKDLTDVKSFNTRNQVITTGTDLDEVYNQITGHFNERISEFQLRDSGWILLQILYIDVNICKFNPLKASSYIPLPSWVQKKHAVLNVKNSDMNCFYWCIVAALCDPVGVDYLTTSYPNFRDVIQCDLEVPVKLRDIPKFEKANPQLSINVYTLEKIFVNNKWSYQVVGPLYLTGRRKLGHINLLLITDDHGNSHYTLVKDLSRLVRKQLSASNNATLFCDACLNHFHSKERYQQHYSSECSQVYTLLPNTETVLDAHGQEIQQNIVKFKHYDRKLRIPIVFYCDFEAMLKPVMSAEPNPNAAFTCAVREHLPYSFGYFMKCSFDDRLSRYESYRGTDVVETFMTRLERDIFIMYNKYLKHVKVMKPLLPHEVVTYNNQNTCHICDLPFDITNPNLKKVRDHDHLTGNFISAAHSICNLNFKIPMFIPIFFHNLNYDSHLFIKQLATKCEDVNVIPQTKEKYISFSKTIVVDQYLDDEGNIKNVKIRLRFLDSFRFLHAPLASLAETLIVDECVEVRKEFGQNFDLMKQKGVFPYDFVDSFERLNLTSLPTKEQFYNTMKEEDISQTEYDRAVQVWQKFNCKSLGEYSDLYLKTDVLLLTDIFENYRSVCLRHYKLDPAHYYTAPGFSWDAMLRYTSVEIELLTDIDMLHFFRTGIRGGVATCVKRKAVANNKFVDSYDPNMATSFIAYLDATNLYGRAMSEYLPQKDFRWLSQEEIDIFNVMNVSDTSSIGYVLEVDLTYPVSLHDAHNDLPFCPQLMVPPTSKFKNPKLIPNLYDKHKYILHYRNLKQCLQAGLILTCIHRVVRFKQAPWLKPYIDLNTGLRNKAKTPFEKDCVKLKINSVFGKTMENVDNRVDVKLLTHWENIGNKAGAERHVSKPNFKNLSIFGEHLVAIEMNKSYVVYDKPMFVGFAILDLSKTVIYDFFYNFLKPKYHEKVSLLYSDTDSLILEIFTENFYEDMKHNISQYDTSNYKGTKLHDMPITESIVGKMKDEYKGVPITSFYGTSAKSYCVRLAEKDILKAKGVKGSAVKKFLTASSYKAVVEGGLDKVFCRQYVFKSHFHTVYTELCNKIALSKNDDKRYVIPGSVDTLAWGNQGLPLQRLVEASNDV